MNRWEALFGIVNVAILFVPVFVVLLSADRTGKLRSADRVRRIARYRKSPESRLLILND
jgi:hypothetical protein